MSLRPFGHHSSGLTSVTNNSLFHQANTGSVFDQVSPAFSAIHLTNTCLLLGSGTYSLRCEVLLPMSTTCSAVQKWFCMMHSCLVASFAYPSFGQPWDSSQSFSTLNGSMASSFFSLFSRSQIGGELSYQSLFPPAVCAGAKFPGRCLLLGLSCLCDAGWVGHTHYGRKGQWGAKRRPPHGGVSQPSFGRGPPGTVLGESPAYLW